MAKASAQITLHYVIDIQGMYRYYLLQSSTLSKPSAPTTYPPTNWDDTEPSYTSGSTDSLYFVDCTVFCNGTFSYSAVSLSTSYEAAKQAYNKANNAQNTANKAQTDIDNLEIGGRNLLISDSVITRWSVSPHSIDVGNHKLFSDEWSSINYPATEYYVSFCTSVKLEVGQTYTFTMYIDREDATDTSNIVLTFGVGTLGYYLRDLQSTWFTYKPTTTPRKIVKTITISSTDLANSYNYFSFRLRNDQAETQVRFKSVKIEKGNRSTDWTPAPEDVDQDIISATDDVRSDMITQNASTLDSCNDLIDSALDDCVKNDEYTSFKQTVETEFDILGDEITMNFTTVNTAMSELDSDVQTKFQELNKHFSFSENGLVISAGENAMSIRVDNDIVVFEKGGVQFGWWDGVDFHTGNIIVDVNERAQFGAFAYVPRSDGSLSFLKVT